MLSKMRGYLKQRIFEFKNERMSVYSQYSIYHPALYFLDILKNINDTFKPYKTKNHRKRDLLQAEESIRKIITGILGLFSSIIFALGALILDGASLSSVFKNIIGNIALIIKGIIELVLSPLVLIRVIWRTAFSPDLKEKQVFQERESIKRLVSELQEAIALNDKDTIGKIRPTLAQLFRKEREYDYEVTDLPSPAIPRYDFKSKSTGNVLVKDSQFLYNYRDCTSSLKSESKSTQTSFNFFSNNYTVSDSLNSTEKNLIQEYLQTYYPTVKPM